MKIVEMMVYFLIVTNCSTICYYEESTLAATVGYFFLAILILGVGKWLLRDEQKKPKP